MSKFTWGKFKNANGKECLCFNQQKYTVDEAKNLAKAQFGHVQMTVIPDGGLVYHGFGKADDGGVASGYFYDPYGYISRGIRVYEIVNEA